MIIVILKLRHFNVTLKQNLVSGPIGSENWVFALVRPPVRERSLGIIVLVPEISPSSDKQVEATEYKSLAAWATEF
jgi:hypothetical protein